jgi:hypothetical protein
MMNLKRGRAMVWILAAGLLIVSGGCEDAEEFRSVAGDSLHTGLTTITTGVLDGLFAVFEPDAETTTQ